jgi:hypothetical protein
MMRMIRSRPVLALLAALMLAAPARAQTAAGPVRTVGARLDAARLSAPATLRPSASTDPSAMLSDPSGLSRPHLYASVPLAALLGVGGMIIGYGQGLVLFDCQDEAPSCARGPDDFEYMLAYAGLTVGAAAGAHRGGERRDSKGSFWATLGGAALGALPVLLAPRDDDQTGAFVGSMVGGTAGAALVDYLVRRPRR